MQRDPHGESPGSTHERMTVAEAATRLGISEHAVRARISRGTLYSERDDHDGRVYVHVPDTGASHGGSHGSTHDGTPGYPELVEALRAQIEDQRAQLAAEREANRENRRIIMQQAQGLSAIEAAEPGQEAAHGPASPGEGATPSPSGEASEAGARRRPFWRRFFGNE